MQYSNIFPNSTQFPNPVYPILAVIISTGLFYTINIFNAPPIIRKLLSLAEDFSHVDRTILYLLLLNFPALVLGLCSLIFNHSITGIEASTDMDIMQVIILGGYICFIEESRQTPICGFLFIRDLIVLIGCLGGLISLHFSGVISRQYGLILGAFYFVYYIMLQFEEKMEDGVLRLLKLRGNDVYNADFLLTQDKKQSNYLQIKETIEENKEAIKQDLQQFKQIVEKAVKSHDEQLILFNFAKLFLPFSKALQIEENQLLQYHLQTIQDDWKDENQESQNAESVQDSNDEVAMMSENKQDISNNNIVNKPTLTDDYVVENYEKDQTSQSRFQKVFKYTFYPIYAFSLAQGRIRYFLDYLAVALLCASLWILASGFAYFTQVTKNSSLQFFSTALAVIMVVPSVRYYIRMSALSDFDFVNIFIQSAILKTVIFSIAITILALVKGNIGIDSSIGSGISLIMAIITYTLFGIFMIAQKFATLSSNLKFFIALVTISFLLRIITELSINLFKTS